MGRLSEYSDEERAVIAGGVSRDRDPVVPRGEVVAGEEREAGERTCRPVFGTRMRGIFAGESNPHRDGYYVETIRRTGRMNRGKFYRLTDGAGRFWEYPAESTIFIRGDLTEERIRALEEERDALTARLSRLRPVVRAAVRYLQPSVTDTSGPLEDAVDDLTPEDRVWAEGSPEEET